MVWIVAMKLLLKKDSAEPDNMKQYGNSSGNLLLV